MAKENQNPEANANDAKVVNNQAIVTNLPTEVKTLSISKISVAKNGANAGNYYFLKGYDVTTKQSITVTMSKTFVEQFGYKDVVFERNFVNEGSANLVLKTEMVYVPNDGKRYGYIDKKKGETVEYRNNGCYIIRDIIGNLDAQAIKKAEEADIIQQATSDIAFLRAKQMFAARKGRPYVAGISDEDENLFDKFYMLCK